MPRFLALAATGLSLAGLLATSAAQPPAEQPEQPGVTLLGTLSDRMYPGSQVAGGATVTDAGHPREQAVTMKTVLTTPDPFEKVVAFYSNKLSLDDAPAGDADSKNDDPKSVTVQDDSENRPLSLRVITVNKLDSTTTLVISRAKGEDQTHIAWLHYLRIGPKPAAAGPS